MAIDDLPLPVVNLLNVLGVPWPYVDEDVVSQFAGFTRDFATAVRTTHDDATRAVAGIATADQGSATDAMSTGWAKMSARHVDEIVDGCHVLAGAPSQGPGHLRRDISRMTTGYDLLIAGDISFARLRAALARINEVPVDAVDVAEANTEDRMWQAAVLCTCEPRTGDIRWSLDVFVSDAVAVRRSVAETAEELAYELRVPVLYDAGGVRPSAYWLAAPEGPRTRARVYDGPGDNDDGSLVIDAVERPVALLPQVRVALQPEVIKDHAVPHPIADAFDDVLGKRGLIPETGDDLWSATTKLRAWEALTVRMTSGWPPDGWYPRDYYRQDLEVRDDLSRVKVPAEVAGPFQRALEAIDSAFRTHTREFASEVDRGWWWGRVPDPEPWPHDAGQSGMDQEVPPDGQ